MTSTPLSDERLRWIEFDAGESNSIILSDTEARIARRLLADAERDLKTLTMQIAKLCHEREHNATRLERLRVAVAPHKRLPMEILSHIFGISSQRGLQIPPRDPPHSFPPWTLRHVCSGWRRIVLSDRRIWSRIYMNFEIGTRLSESAQVRKIQWSERILPTILPKSGTISMSFRITGSITRIQKAIETFIKPYSRRIVALSVGLPGTEFPTFLGMLPNELGVLETLELDFIKPFPVAASAIRVFPSSLCKLVVRGDHSVFSSLRSQDLNWGNIVDLRLLHLDGLTFTEIFSILKLCKRLEQCSIFHWNQHDNQHDNQPIEHAVLPHLHSLSVLSLVGSDFDGFTLPSLCHLSVGHADRFPAAEIASMIHRSGCNMTRLEQINVGAGEAECDLPAFKDILATNSSLKTILAPNIVVHVTVLEQIAQGGLLPNLEMLQCRLAPKTLDFASSCFRGGNTPEAGLSLQLVQDSESDPPRGGANTVPVRICQSL